MWLIKIFNSSLMLFTLIAMTRSVHISASMLSWALCLQTYQAQMCRHVKHQSEVSQRVMSPTSLYCVSVFYIMHWQRVVTHVIPSLCVRLIRRATPKIGELPFTRELQVQSRPTHLHVAIDSPACRPGSSVVSVKSLRASVWVAAWQAAE